MHFVIILCSGTASKRIVVEEEKRTFWRCRVDVFVFLVPLANYIFITVGIMMASCNIMATLLEKLYKNNEITLKTN